MQPTTNMQPKSGILPGGSFSGRVPALVLALGLLGALATVQLAGASSSVTFYKNSLNTPNKRSNVKQFDSQARCKRGGTKSAFRSKIGKKTQECAYRVPVAGKSLELTITGRLFESTPKAIRGRTFLALSLRHAANGSRYQLVLFPTSTRVQIRKVAPNGKATVLATEKLGPKRVKPLGKANKMTFGAYNGTKGKPASNARLFARVNGRRVLLVDDPKGNDLAGTGSSFSIGSNKNARNASGSFSKLIARMPDPFG